MLITCDLGHAVNGDLDVAVDNLQKSMGVLTELFEDKAAVPDEAVPLDVEKTFLNETSDGGAGSTNDSLAKRTEQDDV